jgi:membrane protein DedA with SNARE-associated domain
MTFEVLETRGAPLKSTSVMVMGGGLNKNGDSQMDVAPTIPWILISVVEA